MKNKLFRSTYSTEMSVPDCQRILVEEHDVQSQSSVGMYIHLKRNGRIMSSWTLHGIVPAEFRMKVLISRCKSTTKIECVFNPILCNFTCGLLYIFDFILFFVFATGLIWGRMNGSELIAITFSLILFFFIPFSATILALFRMKHASTIFFKNLLDASFLGKVVK